MNIHLSDSIELQLFSAYCFTFVVLVLVIISIIRCLTSKSPKDLRQNCGNVLLGILLIFGVQSAHSYLYNLSLIERDNAIQSYLDQSMMDFTQLTADKLPNLKYGSMRGADEESVHKFILMTPDAFSRNALLCIAKTADYDTGIIAYDVYKNGEEWSTTHNYVNKSWLTAKHRELRKLCSILLKTTAETGV